MKKISEPLDDIVRLAKDLISLPSISGDIPQTVAVMELIKKELSDYPCTPFASHQFPSLLYSNKEKTLKKFKIILNGHVDVVPAGKEQFRPYIKDGRLYGRGAFDMKATIAVFTCLFHELANKVPYPLGLQLTTDEEIGGMNGTQYQIDKGVRGEFVLTGECGSNLQIAYEAKARMVVKLSAQGKTSHSAHPWLGENAILKLQQSVYNIMQQYPVPKEAVYKTTVNVTHITTNNIEQSNTGYNTTPDYCEALLDVRFIPEEKETIIPRLKSLLTNGVNFEILHFSPVHQTSPDNFYIKQLQKIGNELHGKSFPLIQQHGTSDIRFYSAVDCDGIEFGPIGGNQHQDNEWVDIKSLEQYYEILKTFLLSVK